MTMKLTDVRNQQDFANAITTAMDEYVHEWWEHDLTDNGRAAVKLLQFSPSVISSMMFFGGQS